MTYTDSENAALNLLFAYSLRRTERVKKRELKFSHYATAEVGAQILINQNVWMRNASSMNDYAEVSFGRNCLRKALVAYGERLQGALDVAGNGLTSEVLAQIDAAMHVHHYHTYLTSVSEHRPTDEMGLLSMWRAYGGPTAGVALIFEPHFLDLDTNALAAWSSPVIYGEEAFLNEFERLTSSLEQNVALLKNVEPGLLKRLAFNALQFSILSTKHCGFREEREWRIIHGPREFSSPWVQPSFESVRGRPEVVYHLPLRNVEGMNIPEINLQNLLRRVIIGPCDNPYQIAGTFEDILRHRLGIADADQRIRISGIPLRQKH